MKYRDLIIVIALVAVATIYWSAMEQPPPRLSPSAPEPSPRLSSTEVEPSPQPTRLLKPNNYPRHPDPIIGMSVAKVGSTLDELEVNVALTAQARMKLGMADSEPRYSIAFRRLADKEWSPEADQWLFEQTDNPEVQHETFQKGAELTWTIKLSQFTPPDEMESLAAIYGKEPLYMQIGIHNDESPPPGGRGTYQIHFQAMELPAFREP